MTAGTADPPARANDAAARFRRRLFAGALVLIALIAAFAAVEFQGRHQIGHLLYPAGIAALIVLALILLCRQFDRQQRALDAAEAARRALAESDRKLREVSKGISDLVYSYRLSGDDVMTLEWSIGAGSLAPPPQRIDLARWTAEAFTEPDRPRMLSALRTACSGEASAAVVETAMPEGAGRVLRIRFQPLADEAGGPTTHVVGTVHDITEQAAAERALESRMRARTTVSTLSQIAITETDRQALLQTAIELVCKTFRVDRGGIFRFDSAANRMVVAAAYGPCADSAEMHSMPFSADTLAGYTFAQSEPVVVSDYRMETRFQPPRYLADGAISAVSVPIRLHERDYGVLGVYSDHPDAFSADDTLFLQSVAYIISTWLDRQKELRIRERILDTLPHQIALIDSTGRVFFVNAAWRAFSEALGAGTDVLGVGRNIFSDLAVPGLFGEEDGAAAVKTLVTEAFEGRISTRGAEYTCLVNGAERRIAVSATPVRLSHLNAVVLAQYDVTERRLADARLQDSQRIEALGQLTGGVAHDFNNLLMVILGNLDLMNDEIGDDERVASELSTVRIAAERAAELTDRLLAFARRQTLTPRDFDANLAVAEARKLLGRTLPEHIEIVTETGPAPCMVHADPGEFENAILNLALNSRDAMPDGGRLTIAARPIMIGDGAEGAGNASGLPPGAYVAVSVADTGTGIPEELRAHVFDPFFTSKEVGKGTGLGLSMVYGFARQSGGDAWIESAEGCGTTVRLILPAGGAETPARDDVARARIDGEGRRVLLVEDEALVRDYVAQILAALGFEVVTACDGVEAQARLASDEAIDVLLADIVMPGGVSGTQLARMARETRPDLPVLLMTGYDASGETPADRAGQALPVLLKPFLIEEMAESLAGLLPDAAAVPATD